MILDSRRQALLQGALAAMVRAHWGDGVADAAIPHPVLFGAALVGPADGEVTAWTMDNATPRLGAALRFASRHSATHLHVCVGTDSTEAKTVARQGDQFRLKTTVWCRRDGHGGALSRVPPASERPPKELRAEVLALAPIVKAAGAEIVVEDGVLLAEVLGLEVARVVTPEWSTEPVLQVGVGHHDREARSLVSPDAPPMAALAGVVATVRGLRQPDAPSHPANLLAPERWLRAVVMDHPELAGATELWPLPSPVSRDDLRRRAPAPAGGTGDNGEPLVVICSVGVDPDLIPAGADARLREATRRGLDAAAVKLVVVVPAGDDYPVTRDLAALLRYPATVVTVGRDWRRQ